MIIKKFTQAPIDTTEKFIRIRVRNPGDFEKNSFRTIWLSKGQGIKAVIGRPKGSSKTSVQSILFMKSKWTKEEALQWFKKHKRGLGEESLILNSSIIWAKASILSDNDIEKINPTGVSCGFKNALKEDETRMFLRAEMVHEGINLNDDMFTKDSLLNSYKTAAHQLIDWEHLRKQVIGSTFNSDLIPEKDKIPLAIAVDGVINKDSPWIKFSFFDFMQNKVIEEDREKIIKDRYAEGKLMVSMECFFEKAKCPLDSFETENPIDFEMHRAIHDAEFSKEGRRSPRELINPTFVGMGIVQNPADLDAHVVGRFYNSAYSSMISFNGPEDEIDEGDIEDIEEIIENKNVSKSVKTKSFKGGLMFKNKFNQSTNKTSCEAFKIFSELMILENFDFAKEFVDLQTVLSERFKEETDSLTSKSKEIEEISKKEVESLKAKISELEISISELKKVKETKEGKDITELSSKVVELTATLSANEKKLKEITSELEEKKSKEKMESIKNRLSKEGFELKESSSYVEEVFRPVLNDEKTVEKLYLEMVKAFKAQFTSDKGKELIEASVKNGSLSISGDQNVNDPLSNLSKVRKDFKEKNKN